MKIQQLPDDKGSNGADSLFLGVFERKVSRAGLVHLPAEWRKELGGDSLFMMCDIADPSALCLVPKSVYERELRVSHDENYSVEQRNVLKSARRLHIDVRGGIKFPVEEMNLIGGSGRIVLIGRVTSIQIRPSDESFLHEDDDLFGNALNLFVGDDWNCV